MKLESLANLRMHWRLMDRLKKRQKLEVAAAMFSILSVNRNPIKVKLIRLGKRKLDDDNLQSAFKYVRDAVAKHYGYDDGDRSLIRFKYAQEICKTFAIRIEIE